MSVFVIIFSLYVFAYIIMKNLESKCVVWFLSPWHGMSLGSGWRRWSLDVKGSHEYIE